ncbi:hypothetical protein HELRODRAFT_177230 [Helobdella robusta]|uniref:Uncharacterized protein n=1 Tax=Helobdella robusta TaxID=6412 RepID=T1FBD8_HELRO|nr:hypothetical protein HELRODRAFT_177230 [Helobdella robusta]ESN98344.1 hypothetical protein HELRODRAFT_177230 [Helobdella robusta]
MNENVNDSSERKPTAEECQCSIKVSETENIQLANPAEADDDCSKQAMMAESENATTTATKYAATIAKDATTTQKTTTCNQTRTEQTNSTCIGVLELKLDLPMEGENNLKLRKAVSQVYEKHYSDSLKELKSVHSSLDKSLHLSKVTSDALKQLTNNLFSLEDKLKSMPSSEHFLPNLNIVLNRI